LVDATEAVPLLERGEREAAAFGTYQRQREEAEFGGIGGAIGGAATGLFKGATAGYGDAALVGLGSLVGKGEDVRRTLRGYETYSPIARGLGEAAGFVAPAVATLATGGGAGAAATGLRAATAGGRAVAAAGAATEALAARGLAAAGLAEGGVAARALASAAGQAVELGVYGSGEALSRAVVQRPELTGEQAVAAMGQGFVHGALLGATGGAVLGAGGALLRRGGEAALGGATRAAEVLTGRTSAITGDAVGQRVARLVDTVAPGGIERMAEEKAIKSLGGNQNMIEKALSTAPKTQTEMAKIIVDETPMALGKKPGAILSHTEQKQGLDILRGTIGKEKAALVDQLAAAGVKADVPAIVASLRKEIAPLASSVSQPVVSAYRKVSRSIDALEKNFAGGDVKKIWEQQKALGRDIDWAAIRKGTASKADQELAGVYFSLGKEFERIGEQAQGLGREFVDKWQTTNRRYTAVDMAAKMAEKGRGRDIALRTAGLSEQLGILGGSSTGSTIGGMVAGPVGAAVGSVVGGTVGAISQHLVKKYGDQAAASVLRRVAASGGDIMQAASILARETMGNAVMSYVKRAAVGGAAIAGRTIKGAELLATKASLTDAEKRAASQGSLAKQYTLARAAALKAADPATQQQVSQALTVAAPGGTGQAAARVVKKGALHKIKKIPKHPIAANTLQPHLDESLPSAAEMSRFVRVAAVVDDPTVLFDSLRRGDLTHDEVDTAREVYPEMYAELQQTVLTAVSQLDKPLPYDKALSLGLLVGVPAHPSMTPEYIAAQQAALTAPPEQGQPPAAARRPSNLSRNYDLSTEEA
jgi:hypothetical protein